MYKINWKKAKKKEETNNLHLNKITDKFIIIIKNNFFAI